MFNISDELKKLPDKPGVYIMKNSDDEIIYIGKAVVLKNRVRQYFQNLKNHTPKVRRMVANIASFEYIITDTELEALILECNLIKKHQPKYNILLKDDKHYPYIKITINEMYPRIFMTRKIEKDGAKYFGPFMTSWAVNETIDTLKKIFPIKTCDRVFPQDIGKGRPCLNYHIKKCLGPCRGDVSAEEYKKMMEQVIDFLNGNHEEILKNLSEKMLQASENLEFEIAASLRDRIEGIKGVIQKQKIISAALQDEDVIAFATDKEKTCVQIFFIRGGKLIGREYFILDENNTEPEQNEKAAEEVMESFVKQFYSQIDYIPGDILIQHNINEASVIESWLSTKRGSKVTIKVPQKGDKKGLVDMVAKNAAITLTNFSENITEKEQKGKKALEEMIATLGIDLKRHDEGKIRVEAYDISNTAGFDSVGSMVVYSNGMPMKSFYRRFKIKTVIGANDYESTKELLRRRFTHGLLEKDQISESKLKSEDAKFVIFPDLMLMDGGEIQVKAAKEILNECHISIPVIGMVKDEYHKNRGLLYEGKEYQFSIDSEIYRLVYSIQEEVHRYAIEYHRNLRNKAMTKSILDNIPNIGAKRRNALLKELGSVQAVREASIERLASVKGMNAKIAEMVYNFFRELN